jgi:hypothetical protein
MQLLAYCMQASTAALGFDTRQSLRGNTAQAVGLPLRFITLERICSSSSISGDGSSSSSISGDGSSSSSSVDEADKVELDGGRVRPGLEVVLHVRLGAVRSAGEELMGKPQVPLRFQGY